MRTDRPGYHSKRRKDGTILHYWNPKRAVKGAPDFLRPLRLDDDLTDDQIAQECRNRTEELRKELAQEGQLPDYDGTIKSLIDRYRADTTSPLHAVKHSTRTRDYEPSLRVLIANVGKKRIDLLKASDFRRWFEKWKSSQGRHRRAHGAIKMLRAILTYGAGERLHGCKDAREILSNMQFEAPAARTQAMTYEQAETIVRKSVELKCPSIGFVEALKFETGLRRIDVIGEWAPDEAGKPFRWTGPTAGMISKDLILTIEKTSKTGVPVSRDLKTMPLVLLALQAYTLPEIGPIVIDEDTGKPYRDNHYTPKYRIVREAAGVPSNVWSMDSRAGAVTETISATGNLEDGRAIAHHTTAKMTLRYARGDGLDASRRIAEARVKSRSVTE